MLRRISALVGVLGCAALLVFWSSKSFSEPKVDVHVIHASRYLVFEHPDSEGQWVDRTAELYMNGQGHFKSTLQSESGPDWARRGVGSFQAYDGQTFYGYLAVLDEYRTDIPDGPVSPFLAMTPSFVTDLENAARAGKATHSPGIQVAGRTVNEYVLIQPARDEYVPAVLQKPNNESRFVYWVDTQSRLVVGYQEFLNGTLIGEVQPVLVEVGLSFGQDKLAIPSR